MPDVIIRNVKRSFASAGRSSRSAIHWPSAPAEIGNGPLSVAALAEGDAAATGSAATDAAGVAAEVAAGAGDGAAGRCGRSATHPSAAASATPAAIVARRRTAAGLRLV